MINYNKILEAVNRGIKFALSDLEDNEELSSIGSQKQGQIDDKNYTRELLDLKKEVVDLGLPSKTLWCKYNLGVNPNQLTIPEDWYGGYCAWGELESNKENCSWNNYKFGDCSRIDYKFGIDLNNLTKYCNIPENGLNGFSDKLTQLLPEDDVAYQKKKLHNFKFHIPTREQCEELINYTNNYWVNNYEPNKTIHNPEDDEGIQGLNGRVFEGKNGNRIFIPAAGWHYSFDIHFVGSKCYLWSSSLYLDRPACAYQLFFDLKSINTCNNDRCDGCSVRPVVNL